MKLGMTAGAFGPRWAGDRADRFHRDSVLDGKAIRDLASRHAVSITGSENGGAKVGHGSGGMSLLRAA